MRFPLSRRTWRITCVGVLSAILIASTAAIWTLLTYTQNHALAAAEASDISEDLQRLAEFSLQAAEPGADVVRLRAEAKATASQIETSLHELQARRINASAVAPMSALVRRYFAELDREAGALRYGDLAMARQVATRAATTTLGPLAHLRDEMVLRFNHDAATSHNRTRFALAGLVGGLMGAMGAVVLWAERQHRGEEKLRSAYEERERFEAVVRNASDLIVVMGTTGAITYVSPSARSLLGYDPDAWLGRTRLDIVHASQVAEAGAAFRQASAGESGTLDLRVLHADGGWRIMEVNFSPLERLTASPSVLITARDVTERRELEDQLTRQAFEDSLTGLPNRALLQDRLAQALARADRTDKRVAVLLLDLDGFKDINDGFGHSVGDEVLIEVAGRLRRTVRPGDTIARFGGDEFVVVLEDEEPEQVARQVASRLRDLLEQPIRVGTNEHRMFVSTGIAVGDGYGVEELIRNADLAMYAAKARGRGHTVTFEADMHDDARTRVELAMDLNGAIDRGELIVHFQPIVDLRTGDLVGAEALVRWRHPRRGLIAPGVFIPIAEGGGQIAAIGAWVLAEACRQAALWGWRSDGPYPKSMSVNVSGHQVMDPAFVDTVRSVLADTGLPPSTLVLEITETVLMEGRAPVLPRLQDLKALGVRIALDDYGTGYSSMSRLATFPVDVLKIDRSFVVASARGDAGARALVKSIITLCDDLDTTAVAEGIEEPEEIADMLSLGCRLGQGYLIGRPMPVALFERMMPAALLNCGGER
jgi:diguanylate cyclase (GGDEF)-like protein/PAS domain S-box-containing protein